MPIEKRQITRHRTSHSCQTCRRRKVKCGKERPICGSCEKTGEECIYDEDKAFNSTVVSHQEITPSKKRKKDEEEPDDHSQSDHARLSDIAMIESQVAELASALKELHGWSSPQDVSFNKSSRTTPTLQSSEDCVNGGDETCAPETTERAGLSTTQNSLKEQGATHPSELAQSDFRSAEMAGSDLSTISQRLSHLNQTLRTSMAKPSSASPAKDDKPSNRISRDRGAPARLLYRHGQQMLTHTDLSEEVITLVRDEEQSNVLFRTWLTNVYPVLPIVDPIQALHRYEAFHKWYRREMDKGLPDPVADARPLIIAIYYAGTVSISKRGARRWFPELSRRTLMAAMRLHFRRSLEQQRPHSLETIAAMVMMQYMCPEWLDNIQAGTRLNTIIRSAQALALHRRPPLHLPFVEKGIRRRLWMEIVHLDASLATSGGLPPMLNDRYFENSLPSDFKDYQSDDRDYFSHETTTEVPDNPRDYRRTSQISVHNLVARARAMIAMTTNGLNAIIMGTAPITRDELAAMRRILNTFELHVRAIINRIPAEGSPELELEPMLDETGQSLATDYSSIMGEPLDVIEVEHMVGQDPAIRSSHMPFIQNNGTATKCFHSWARVLLSMAIDQVHCLTYRPFLRSKLWKMARQCALKHCHSFLRKYTLLATNLECERFRWTAMPLPQPRHATAIVLTDLYEHPDSPEAARSRALIDQMLLLRKTSYGLVGGDYGLTFFGPLEGVDSEARALFSHLRSTAWQMVGLDPSCLWTEEEQIKVGAAVHPTEFDRLVQNMREDNLSSVYNGACIPLASIIQLNDHELRTMNGELKHPSDAGIPPASSIEEGVYSMKISPKSFVPKQRLDRAHPQQEPVPPHATKASADLWHHLPQLAGHPFGGMNELIDKIRTSHLPTDNGHAASALAGKGPTNVGNNEQRPLGVDSHPTAPATDLKEYPYIDRPVEQEPNAVYEGLSFTSTATQQVRIDNPGHDTTSGVVAPIASSLDFDWDHWDWVFGQADENSLHPAEDIDRDMLSQIFTSEP